jgi:hypothetical protein
VVSLVLVVAIFDYLVQGIDLGQVWAEIQAMTWREDAILAVIAAWNLATYPLVWTSVTPGLGFWWAMVMTQATTAVTNTVPAGSAIGIGMTYGMARPVGLFTVQGVGGRAGLGSVEQLRQAWPTRPGVGPGRPADPEGFADDCFTAASAVIRCRVLPWWPRRPTWTVGRTVDREELPVDTDGHA